MENKHNELQNQSRTGSTVIEFNLGWHFQKTKKNKKKPKTKIQKEKNQRQKDTLQDEYVTPIYSSSTMSIFSPSVEFHREEPSIYSLIDPTNQIRNQLLILYLWSHISSQHTSYQKTLLSSAIVLFAPINLFGEPSTFALNLSRSCSVK